MVQIPSELIESVKQQILLQCDQEPEKYDSTDIETFNETDEMIKRHIFDYQINNSHTYGVNDDTLISKVTSNVLFTLKWRKEIGVNSMKDSDFPLEFYHLDFFRPGKQKDGQLFLVLNIGRLQRLSTWSEVWIRFIVHECEKLTQGYIRDPDHLSKSKAIVLCDTSEIQMAHLDFKFIIKIISIFLHHSTQTFGSIWIYNLPMFSLSLRPIINASLPKKITRLVFFTDSKNIVKDLGDENVPVEYGGKSKHPLQSITPVNASSIGEVGKLWSFDENEIRKMKHTVAVKLRSIGK